MGRPDTDREEASPLEGHNNNAPSSSAVSDFQSEPPTPSTSAADLAVDLAVDPSESRVAPPPEYNQPTIVTADFDLPPDYHDVAVPDAQPLTADRPPPDLEFLRSARFKASADGTDYYLHRNLDENPAALERAVRYWATRPPRQYMRIKGTHRETVRRSNDKTSTQTVTDFDVKVELTPYLYRDPEQRVSMCTPRTVENHEKARRGTSFKTYAPNTKPAARLFCRRSGHGRIELGSDDDNPEELLQQPKPTLSEWCHRYCAAYASLKTFRVQRRVVGLDRDLLRDLVTTLVRDTNYRGSLTIDFPIKNADTEVHNDCMASRWRLTTWVRVLFYVTFLFLLVWPYLLLTTRRFEVVVVDWPFSRHWTDSDTVEYASVTEQQLFNLWGRALNHAVLSKRVCTLDQQDLIDAEGRTPLRTGNQIVDGLVASGVRAMNEVNRQMGWGRNQC